MDAHRFGVVAKRLGKSHITRRMTIRTGEPGLLALAAEVFRQRSGGTEALAGTLIVQSTPGATPKA